MRHTPTGSLRASINLGNPILANTDAGTGAPCGVSVDLAQAFAQRLGVGIELVVFDSAGESVQAVTDEKADIGFFAVDPLRGAGIAFTALGKRSERSDLVEAAGCIDRSVEGILENPSTRTADLGGTLGCRAFARLVAELVGG
jgi:polar amino acid transport system substrate-binding protein